MLNEKIYVFDDIIDVNSQNDIVKLLIKDYDLDGKYPFPWYYIDDITLDEGDSRSQRRDLDLPMNTYRMKVERK